MNEKAVGHCGTLDPLASGLLVVCVGAATRLVPYLSAVDKVYRALRPRSLDHHGRSRG
nr:hypothetical protein [Nannocystis pusilla]